MLHGNWVKQQNTTPVVNAACCFQDGHTEGEMIPVRKCLEKLTSTKYSFDELQQRPLPNGVDPLKLETYLIEDQFEVSDCV